MSMSHIYQPVMLMELLKQKGKAAVSEIAKTLLVRDKSQVEYYEHITKNMVGRVLTKSRGLTSKDKDEYIEKRGDKIWSHRKKSSGYISGTLRHEVLKRAKFRSELCGISAENKALEVDHIIPRNNGGSDDISNL